MVPSSIVPRGTRAYVFQEIYTVFLALGTLVGVVVVGYMLHKAYRYRSTGPDDGAADRPTVGEIPSGGGGGRKLFVSFALSAVIVVSLISWTYFTLLYVEDPSPTGTEGDPVEIRVVGHQFYWEFVYPNGYSTTATMRVPADRRIQLTVTSADVFHNFGAPDLRVKADAIPGQETTTWFEASEPGSYPIHCYELCGAAHSYMDGTVRAMPASEYREWYAGTSNGSASSASAVTPPAGVTTRA